MPLNTYTSHAYKPDGN